MPRKEPKEVKNKRTLEGQGSNKWKIATATSDRELIELLEDDFEPYSVDQGVHYLKKKGGN